MSTLFLLSNQVELSCSDLMVDKLDLRKEIRKKLNQIKWQKQHQTEASHEVNLFKSVLINVRRNITAQV